MELDDAYANGPYIDGADAYPPRWEQFAASFRAATRCELDVAYGDRERERFDLFLPSDGPKGVVIFVHGGYWLAFDKSSWSHLAAGPLRHGWAVAMPSYDLCPAVRIGDIGDQIAAAITAIGDRIEGPIRLTGHSAGGQLVARLASTERVERVVPISPVADLAPLMHTSMNERLRIDEAEARAESPIHLPAPAASVTVWVGSDERPAFLTQAESLATAWGCEHVIDPGLHHYNVVEELGDPESALTRSVVR